MIMHHAYLSRIARISARRVSQQANNTFLLFSEERRLLPLVPACLPASQPEERILYLSANRSKGNDQEYFVPISRPA